MKNLKVFFAILTLITLISMFQPFLELHFDYSQKGNSNLDNSAVFEAGDSVVFGQSSCSDECSDYGQKSCYSNTQYQYCGNYDCDACLEFSSPYSCPSGQVCQGNGQCVDACTPHNYQQCYNNDVYWYDSCNIREDKSSECGNSGWTGDYRCDSSRYLQRKWLDKGCSNASCYTTPDWRTQEDCGFDSWTDNYQCSGDWVQRQKTLKGCSSLSCFENNQWFNFENCSSQGKTCSGGSCVYTNLNVTCSASPNPADINEAVIFSAHPSGGSGNYSYIWSGACNSYSQTCSKSFSQSGSYLSDITVYSGGQTASAGCSIQVNEPQCECSSWNNWQNQGCGKGSCVSNQMEQTRTRTCFPSGCNTELETRCIYDSSCEPSCTDECAYQGQTSCYDDGSKKTCGYYDADSCLEWSSPQTCGTDGCIGTAYRDYYCSGGICSYSDQACSTQCFYCGDNVCDSGCGENTNTCSQDCGSDENEDIPTGNLFSNKTYLCTNETASVTINGQDDQGIEKLSLYYSGSWHNQSCSYNTNCTKTWNVSIGNEGYYNYTGKIYGRRLDHSSEQTYTSPNTITIHFDDCGQDCSDECAYSGQARCYNSTSRQICGDYDSDSCLEWSNRDSCQGSTSCGYGRCDNDERPQWRCSGGDCEYDCGYSSSCGGDDHDYKRCYNNDVYWYNSSGHRQDKYDECGSDSCGSWDYYCSGKKVYKKRDCYDKGCDDSKCFKDKDVERKYVKTCDDRCDDGKCVDECECDSGPCCDGCNYKDKDTPCDNDRQTQYSCPWGTSCGADTGVRSRIRYQYCSGDDDDCDGDWGSWYNWSSWRVADYCTNSETCSYGDATCNYNSTCQTTPTYTNYKQCYDSDVYWFRSDGTRLSKYMECNDTNACTLDNCSGDRCVNDLKCDGTTCAKGSQEYCSSCESCGDGICNCDEDFCGCAVDCTLPSADGLAVSSLVKLKGDDTMWKKDLRVEPGDELNVLIVVATAGQGTITGLTLENNLPDDIEYLGNLRINSAVSGADILTGINIGALPANESKIITFDAKVSDASNFSTGSTYLNNLSVVRYDSGKTKYASVGIEVIRDGLGVAAAGTIFSQIVGIIGTLAFWLVMLFLVILAIILSLIGYYFLRKKREVRIV